MTIFTKGAAHTRDEVSQWAGEARAATDASEPPDDDPRKEHARYARVLLALADKLDRQERA